MLDLVSPWVQAPSGWNCTETGCSYPAVLKNSTVGSGAGLCVAHAYTKGLIPAINGLDYTSSFLKPATFGWLLSKGQTCTIGSHYGTYSASALMQASGYVIFACEEHASYFLTAKEIENLKTKGSMILTKWGTVWQGKQSGQVHTGWNCTEHYVGTHSHGGQAVLANPNGGKGLCLQHALAHSDPEIKALIPLLIPGKSPLNYDWEPPELVSVCTMADCVEQAVAHLKGTDHYLCHAHVSPYLPVLSLKMWLSPPSYLIPEGVHKIPGTTWQMMATSGVTFKCTVVSCSKIAVAYETTKKHAMICEEHKKALAGWISVMPVYTAPVKSIHYGETPTVSVLQRARDRKVKRERKPVVVKAAPIDTSRGIDVDKSEALLYFPFVEDMKHNEDSEISFDDDDTEYPNAVEKIGLDSKLPLIQAAAEFYLLMDASLCPPSDAQRRATGMFKELTDFLAWQMRLYIECACLGEARYAASRCADSVDKAKFLQNPKWRKIFNDITSGGYDRFTVWTKFPKVVDRQSRSQPRNGAGWGDLMVFTMLIHETLHWRGGGYGGKKWGQCAKTVLQYIRGKLTPEAFVDTAFGLKHNGNIVFDKLWQVHSIEAILDANQRGDMEALLPIAAPDVTAVWKEANE